MVYWNCNLEKVPVNYQGAKCFFRSRHTPQISWRARAQLTSVYKSEYSNVVSWTCSCKHRCWEGLFQRLRAMEIASSKLSAVELSRQRLSGSVPLLALLIIPSKIKSVQPLRCYRGAVLYINTDKQAGRRTAFQNPLAHNQGFWKRVTVPKPPDGWLSPSKHFVIHCTYTMNTRGGRVKLFLNR
jgi:hypothetical protein